MSESVLLSIDDGIATLTLNEPETRNALTQPVYDALERHLDTIETASDVRCVVIEGTGKSFSAGGDIEGMSERLTNDDPTDDAVSELARRTRDTIARVVALPVPTVAKVDGSAVGAGANLAIACDIQLASESASIGFVFRQVGLSVDAGTSYLLPRIVGTNVAKELVFTGEILDAERATELGLFNHVYDAEAFESEVEATVSRIANGPTVALRHSKRLLQDGLEKSFGRAQRDEATAQGIVFETADHEEGVEAFLTDRRPEFVGR
ncbi:enoyl-CoA hydratase [Haloarcula rubripromontorii]|uniref:Enoyl-CoA hydratase n=1 Tax=Haloarcula rubripromontorii TaxID=1705562 RepID=A0A0N0BPA2_9EURY|nr:enoyl-CoA hydratase [Haloarcula rubripromontorii]KOX93666.1 enoyl-CoA hydratase [Haloarcula rubripromontorii]